ncbi:MAG: type II toxin-antitoxin system VapC family toxin [Crenarchaeota archaeon]|nr:type II toxin-antitoxin system VapC family toxin [Thermoproteota archaeon]
MKYLYDASALLNTIRLRKQDSYKVLKDNSTLSLTKYEVGNTLWKEALLKRRISVEEAFETIFLLEKVLKIMRIVEVSNSSTALKLAYELQTTYYDASYIVASVENNTRLVTDDAELIRKIRENVNIIIKITGRKLETIPSSKT